ncbi:MAG: S9 family peptidase, partial [Jatrophihabitans sp.]
MPDSPFAPASFTALPRLTGLALSREGDRLVATLQQPDAKGARYTSSIWEIPLEGSGECVRLTRSEKGETAPVFLPDGALVFTSSRPAGDQEDEEPALWLLPRTGEPRLLATVPGGLGGAVIARDAGTVVATGSRLTFGDDASPDAEADAAARKDRKDRRLSAILHTGMPIRHWDTELGDTSPRLFALGADGAARDLAPDAGQALHQASYSICADGTVLLADWRMRRRGGCVDPVVVRLDPATGAREILLDEEGVGYERAVIAPDGARMAVTRLFEGDFETPFDQRLQLRDLAGGVVRDVELGDLAPSEYTWSTDSGTLFVAGNLHGRGAVVAVDGATGATIRRLVSD